MEAFSDLAVKAGDWLLSQGAMGVLCLALVVAIIWLIRLLDKKQGEVEKNQEANLGLWNTIMTLQEKRVSEKEEIIRVLETARSSMETNTNATSGLQQTVAALHAVVVDRSRR